MAIRNIIGKIQRIDIYLLIFVSVFLNQNIKTQNLSFSNYKQASLLYNPANLSGSNVPQASVNFRNIQIIEGVNYYTSLFTIQTPIKYQFKKIYAGTIGSAVFDDRMSNSGYISTTGFALAYSQPVQISSSSSLILGLQYNYYQKKFDISGYSTGNQWDLQTGLNPALSLGEDYIKEVVKCYTLNSGLLWQLSDANSKTKAFFGVAIYNLNTPNESFSGSEHLIARKYIFTSGYKVFDNGAIQFTPEILFVRQGSQNNISSGITMGIATLGKNPLLPFNSGFFNVETKYLSNQSVMVGASLEQPRYDVGLSYEYSVGSSFPVKSNAFELFVVIKFGKSKPNTLKQVAQDYKIGEVRDFFENKKQVTEKDIYKGKPAENESVVESHKPVSLALKRDFKFGFNDASLSDESKAYLDELVELLMRNKHMTIEIVGHTDDVGTEDGNRIISNKRAQIVADYFILKGVDKQRILVTGKLDKEPLFPNISPENRAKNRRVEFIITE